MTTAHLAFERYILKEPEGKRFETRSVSSGRLGASTLPSMARSFGTILDWPVRLGVSKGKIVPRSNLRTAALVALALAGCHRKPQPPTGQVAATVGGQEITVRQIDAELNGNVPTDPKVLKALQERALQEIIFRTLLAEKAKSDGLNKTPDYALQEQRAKDALLANMYQAKLAAAVPAPTDDEAQAYMTAHPDLFAQRKIFSVNQVIVGKQLSPDVLKALVPIKSLDQAEALLSQNQLPFHQQAETVDAISIDPRLADAFAKLPSDDILIIPQSSGAVLNSVVNTRIQPFTGPAALTYAKNLMHAQSVQEAEARQLQTLLHDSNSKIAFNPTFAPASTSVKKSSSPSPKAGG